jgi:ribose transport system substrate-binding protein
MKAKIFFVMVLLSLVFSGGVFAGGQQDGEQEIILGKIPITLVAGYHQSDVKWAQMYAEEKYGVKVKIIDGEFDTDVTMNAVEDFVAQGVNGIMLHTFDPVVMDQMVATAHADEVPIVTFYLEPETRTAPHVQIDEAATSFQLGVKAAQKWLEYHPNEPIKVGMVSYLNIESVLAIRSMPFFDGVKSIAPDAELVSRLDGAGSVEISMAAAQDMLQAHPEVNVIYGANADHCLGALAAFESAGRGKAVDGVPQTEIFVGTDATEAELLKVFDPSSALKVTQGLQPKINAMAKVDLVMQMVNGEISYDEWKLVKTQNILLNYWDNTIDEGTKFLQEQYFSDVDLKVELGL